MTIVESICQELDASRNLALVHIVGIPVEEGQERAPHRPASMLVGERGLVAGSLGSGDLEAKVIEAGMRVAEKGVAEFLDCHMPGEPAPGMSHGESVRLFLEPIRSEPRTGVLYKRLSIALACGDDMFSVTPVRAPGQRLLCRTTMRTWPVPSEIACLLRQKLEEGAFTKAFAAPFELKDSMGQRFVVVPWPAPWRLVLAGGGRVAQNLAQMAAGTDLAVCVLDDREDCASGGLFPGAAVIRKLDEYEDCFAGMSLDDKSLVVIGTRDHLHDHLVLARALRTKAGCICVTATPKELCALLDHLRCEGFDEQDLARVTAPMGLDTGAALPEEIAGSVMARLTAARARTNSAGGHLPDEGAGCGLANQ